MSQEISKSNLVMGYGYPKFEFFESENSYGEIGFSFSKKLLLIFGYPTHHY